MRPGGVGNVFHCETVLSCENVLAAKFRASLVQGSELQELATPELRDDDAIVRLSRLLDHEKWTKRFKLSNERPRARGRCPIQLNREG